MGRGLGARRREPRAANLPVMFENPAQCGLLVLKNNIARFGDSGYT
jgi:hypothetical protein